MRSTVITALNRSGDWVQDRTTDLDTIVVASVGTGGASAWIQDNVVQIIILVLGCIALFAGRRGDFAKVATILGCALLGLGVLALSFGDNATAVGEWLVSLFIQR